ncbi:MAG: hypothetical protein HY912_15040 [Desulfomonile tiedjei]|uniref:Uncharacterized protein n=1 Tax=Desulfomonile tiedjei TaxID=2358 RepID=A0A9D6V3F0_9BACT|nr:hypothetical protein [Desulfomonile tiedjei]
MQPNVAHKIRTIWFLTAMIPLIIVVGVLGVASLVLTSPLMIYATVQGKHLKNPWRKPLYPGDALRTRSD